MLIIHFDFSTSDFDHAVKVCEAAFGYKGEEWEKVKASKDLTVLRNFMKADAIDVALYKSIEK